MFGILDLAAALLVLSAAFGWFNRRFVGLPHAIGVLVLGLALSAALVLLDKILPGSTALEDFSAAVRQVDFFNTLMNGMLGFLLFAGALQVDFNRLRNERWSVALMATIGVTVAPLARRVIKNGG